jgi:hypothetical protein
MQELLPVVAGVAQVVVSVPSLIQMEKPNILITTVAAVAVAVDQVGLTLAVVLATPVHLHRMAVRGLTLALVVAGHLRKIRKAAVVGVGGLVAAVLVVRKEMETDKVAQVLAVVALRSLGMEI